MIHQVERAGTASAQAVKVPPEASLVQPSPAAEIEKLAALIQATAAQVDEAMEQQVRQEVAQS